MLSHKFRPGRLFAKGTVCFPWARENFIRPAGKGSSEGPHQAWQKKLQDWMNVKRSINSISYKLNDSNSFGCSLSKHLKTNVCWKWNPRTPIKKIMVYHGLPILHCCTLLIFSHLISLGLSQCQWWAWHLRCCWMPRPVRSALFGYVRHSRLCSQKLGVGSHPNAPLLPAGCRICHEHPWTHAMNCS